MIPFELLLRPAISAGVSVALQHDAADDIPVVRREPLPVESANALEAFGNPGLHGAKQRQDGRLDGLPFRASQTRYLCQTGIADGTPYPRLQQQQPQRAVLVSG